jgi:hypothetical protein
MRVSTEIIVMIFHRGRQRPLDHGLLVSALITISGISLQPVLSQPPHRSVDFFRPQAPSRSILCWIFSSSTFPRRRSYSELAIELLSQHPPMNAATSSFYKFCPHSAIGFSIILARQFDQLISSSWQLDQTSARADKEHTTQGKNGAIFAPTTASAAPRRLLPPPSPGVRLLSSSSGIISGGRAAGTSWWRSRRRPAPPGAGRCRGTRRPGQHGAGGLREDRR